MQFKCKITFYGENFLVLYRLSKACNIRALIVSFDCILISVLKVIKLVTTEFIEHKTICSSFIRITCPCSVYPLEPQFYIAKLEYAGVYLFFLFLLQNIDCGYSLEPPRP